MLQKKHHMAHVKVWLHVVWATKERRPYLEDTIRKKVLQHIKENAKLKNIHLDTINGHLDHVHCLMGLNTDMTIAKAINLLKGESSFWINKNKLCTSRFEWCDLYFAASVSESLLNDVRNYILNQEKHHEKISFDEEYRRIID